MSGIDAHAGAAPGSRRGRERAQVCPDIAAHGLRGRVRTRHNGRRSTEAVMGIFQLGAIFAALFFFLHRR